jgi:hypothetical protein
MAYVYKGNSAQKLRCAVGENIGQRNDSREEHSIKCGCVSHAFMF